MPNKTPPRRVALVVETSTAPRRRMLGGVAGYMHEHEPWAIYLKPFGVEKSLEDWLTRWQGDGIIAAIADPNRRVLWRVGLPVFGRASTDILAVDDPAVVAALRFIRDNAPDTITVDDVVHRTMVSRSVLERRFRKAVGRPINSEIVRVRLNRAVQLLCETRLELKVIAARAGFGSTSYMNAVFREKLGRTPGSYRGVDRGRAPQSDVAQKNVRS